MCCCFYLQSVLTVVSIHTLISALSFVCRGFDKNGVGSRMQLMRRTMFDVTIMFHVLLLLLIVVSELPTITLWV